MWRGDDHLCLDAADGGPVVADGKIYFAAGIFPFEGAYVYALEAESGDVQRVNEGTDIEYINQPHKGTVPFAAPTPQGYLVATGDKLLVPTEQAVPAFGGPSQRRRTRRGQF